MNATDLLLLTTAGHAGFSLTVTLLVYPQLADVPMDRWPQVHASHSQRIVPIVALLYAGVLAASAWTLATGWSLPAVWAVAAAGAAMLTTALGAAPLHGRLGVKDDTLVRRLLLVDRVRTGAALAAAAGAGMAA